MHIIVQGRYTQTTNVGVEQASLRQPEERYSPRRCALSDDGVNTANRIRFHTLTLIYQDRLRTSTNELNDGDSVKLTAGRASGWLCG